MTVHSLPTIPVIDSALASAEVFTVQQWRALPEDVRCELVDGVLLMSPGEISDNRIAVGEVAFTVRRDNPGLRTMQDASVMIDAGRRPTVRIPDLVVVERGSARDVHEVDPADILLVVEAVSPSSRETDWVHKRREYAAAGIPTYLVVDLEAGRLTVFTQPVDEWYTQVTTGGGVEIDLAGNPISLNIAGLT